MIGPAIEAYSEALLRWLKVQKDHPEINHGHHEPKAADYQFISEIDQWHAGKIKERVVREFNRMYLI